MRNLRRVAGTSRQVEMKVTCANGVQGIEYPEF